VGEQTGNEKLAVLLSLWQPLVKLLSPGGADRIQLKSYVGMPEMIEKVELCSGYGINLRSNASGKKIFTSMLFTIVAFKRTIRNFLKI
jgi:hypothetical protein